MHLLMLKEKGISCCKTWEKPQKIYLRKEKRLKHQLQSMDHYLKQ